MKTHFAFICFLLLINTAFSQDHFKFDSTLSPIAVKRTLPPKKWSFNAFQGVSAGITSFGNNRANILSIQAGLQVNRMITNNLFAFGAVSVAPSYMNFNRSFLNTDFSKTGRNGFRTANVGLNPGAEIGLGYTNDARTFSISGSIGVRQNAYYPGGYFMPYRNYNQQSVFR